MRKPPKQFLQHYFSRRKFFSEVSNCLNCKFPACISVCGAVADKLIGCLRNLCILVRLKTPGLRRIACFSTLFCVSSPHALITMPVKAARFFSFQCVLIIEWQVKKPHTVVGILIPVCLSHVKQFQYCAAIILHLLYGMEKMHCHHAAVKEPLRDNHGNAETLTVTQAGGRWASDLDTTNSDTGQKMK